jgi:hypothetical protein
MATVFNPEHVDKEWFVGRTGRLSFLFDAAVGGMKIRDAGFITGISYSSAQRIGEETAEVIKFTTESGYWQARYKLFTAKGNVKKKQDDKVPALAELAPNLQGLVGTYLPTTYYLASVIYFHLLRTTYYLSSLISLHNYK